MTIINKTFALFFAFLWAISVQAGLTEDSKVVSVGDFKCKRVNTVNKSEHYECPIKNIVKTESDKKKGNEKEQKIFHVLNLKGDFKQISYDHGYLLGHLINKPDSLANQIKKEVKNQLHSDDDWMLLAKRYMFNCVVKNMSLSVSEEFHQSILELYRGYGDRIKEKDRSLKPEDFVNGIYGIEIGNILSTILHQYSQTNKLDLAKRIGKQCGKIFVENAVSDFSEWIQEQIERLIKTGFTGKYVSHGCTAFISPASSSKNGQTVQGRNLDGDMVKGWTTDSVLSIVQEPNMRPYVAAAAAGVNYPGGISGFNDRGISVSTHQFYATDYQLKVPGRKANILPFVSQDILRRASNFADVKKILKETEHFSSWTLFMTDTKTNEVKSIEVTPSGLISYAREFPNKPMGQANDFVGEKSSKYVFYPNFGKFWESFSRKTVIEKSLERDGKNKLIDADWGILHLASHEDMAVGDGSFGGRAVKAYHLMTTVVVPEKRHFWVTLGDAKPGPGTVLGFEVDWNNPKKPFTELGLKRVERPKSHEGWEQSLSTYVNARLDYKEGKPKAALAKLKSAIEQAGDVKQTTYFYMAARLAHELGQWDLAAQYWKKLLEMPKESFLDYHLALVKMYAMETQNRRVENLTEEEVAQREADKKWAVAVFDKYLLEKDRPYSNHFDLHKKKDLAEAILKKEETALPKLDFVVVMD